MAEIRKSGRADEFIAIPNQPWRPIGGEEGVETELEETVGKGEAAAAVQDFVANGPLTTGVSFQALSQS